MKGAAVPEAAVNENGDPLFRKHKIGVAKHRGPAAPTADLEVLKYGDKPQLSGSVVPTLNARHYLRSLRGWENVSQCEIFAPESHHESELRGAE